ncbi:winged helix-turn-helix domain-containing protein [Azospirillum isscasi]|uniref:Transcriptional regulator n=1 Tax=Azospirillum isscasi TaxID=3053926 RepID=A0ABU0WH45_9PROT|nr:transcriptional regulator [Azospirillum isscasi]MDQ2103412.1 transcriptional regulator [Azospirillum isscasi]
MDTLDPLLHQPLRTQIAAFLTGAGEATFTELKQRLEVSDGNLDSHLKKLIAAGYVSVRKDTGGEGRPQSSYALTPLGREALHGYIAALQRLLPMDRAAASATGMPLLKPRTQ